MMNYLHRRGASWLVAIMIGLALGSVAQRAEAQQTAAHSFEQLPDGGRIEMRHNADDAAAITHIREHLQSLAVMLGTGEANAHMQSIPGTAVMIAKRAAITYAYRELPRGAEVRITTRDGDALRAVHEFLGYHKEHHSAGAAHPSHHGADHAQRDHGAMQHSGMHQGGMHQNATHHGTQHGGVHQFDALADGGRIEAQRADDDAAGIAHIRQHLQAVALAFSTGDFSAEDVTPLRAMPGVAAMIASRSAITYTYRELARGGEVRIVTRDAAALKAIHEFVSFHKQHHSGAHHGGM